MSIAGTLLWPRSSPSALSASAVLWTIFLGCATYVLYAGSLLCYNQTKDDAFTIAAGGLLDVGADLLWTAQGAIMMVYPREHDKGKFIGYFWAIFDAGAVLGCVIAFAINNKVVVAQSLGDSTYIVFISLMAIDTFIALSLCPLPRSPTRTEAVAVMKLFLDWRMVVLILMFLSSNWFYSYQLSTANGAYFSTRTQSPNNIFYCQSQDPFPLGLITITVCFVATWVGGIFFQKRYAISSPKGSHDYTEGASYVGPLFLYMFYGLNDAA
ncbi:hypothetical protein BG015_011339 [Linnemannia schmuckeri]|uniref:Uncharacterized protein n=1 Tax=Linnemannia schmuckeri TaxID=64567 RepID=A0A9P5S7B2_9FUNG|nr:hypothetical protein BG015_011339 [Linnemannia schmuckeri]